MQPGLLPLQAGVLDELLVAPSSPKNPDRFGLFSFEPAGGVFSGGGMESVGEEGWMRVEAGSALVSEEVSIERITNAGDTPLEILQVTLRFPELDSETGHPVGNELVTDHGKRARQNERRDRQVATPAP